MHRGYHPTTPKEIGNATLMMTTPLSKRPYQICTNCVMDTSDPAITFDARGVCDQCNSFYANVLPSWHTDERGRVALEAIVERIKAEGKG